MAPPFMGYVGQTGRKVNSSSWSHFAVSHLLPCSPVRSLKHLPDDPLFYLLPFCGSASHRPSPIHRPPATRSIPSGEPSGEIHDPSPSGDPSSSGETRRDPSPSGEVRRDLSPVGEIQWYPSFSGEIRRDPSSSGEIHPPPTRCGEIQPFTARSIPHLLSSVQIQVIFGRWHVGIMSAEPVGNYGIKINFDDLHKTGISTWDYFYQLGTNRFTVMRSYIQTLKKHNLSRDPQKKKWWHATIILPRKDLIRILEIPKLIGHFCSLQRHRKYLAGDGAGPIPFSFGQFLNISIASHILRITPFTSIYFGCHLWIGSYFLGTACAIPWKRNTFTVFHISWIAVSSETQLLPMDCNRCEDGTVRLTSRRSPVLLIIAALGWLVLPIDK